VDNGEVVTVTTMAEEYSVGESRDPVATDRQLAGWWTRVWAYLLDAVIAGLPGFLLIVLCHQGSIGRLIGYLLTSIITVVYGATLLGLYGRTLGMRLLRIRVTNGATGRDVTRREAWQRALMAFALYQLVDTVLLLIEWSEPTGWSSHHHPVVSVFNVIQLVLYLGLLMPIWDSRNQTLQDKAVGSIVVVW
jgi:uncharacterized RDD family membrane protein YckC